MEVDGLLMEGDQWGKYGNYLRKIVLEVRKVVVDFMFLYSVIELYYRRV